MGDFSRGQPLPHTPPAPPRAEALSWGETGYTHADSSKDRDTQEESILCDSGEGGSRGHDR